MVLQRFVPIPNFKKVLGIFLMIWIGKMKGCFYLIDKKAEDFVIFFILMAWNTRFKLSFLGSAFPNSLATAFGDKFNLFWTTPLFICESNCKNAVAQDFVFKISVFDVGFMKKDSSTLQVFDERSYSTNDYDLQLGYHMPISDTGGTNICGRGLFRNFRKVTNLR
ncbi:hypothetical protein DVH24_035977 [Malus domestica]|uniref:Uncharacterized protein n=1 Tax=Malus domestica TaxID=3750 RepID=A0A498JMX8_MALDO|nr:hypothetical protein DVH24_035977 [Malus domestica]